MDADRNLLFGVLALQADLISPAQFAEACSTWAARKTEPLAELLLERRWLTPADKADVERLLDRKLKKHAGDVRASLAEVMAGPIGESLAGTGEPAVRASLAGLLPGVAPVLISTGDFVPESRDRYTLSRLHATGGLGRVWLARDVPLNRDVALKEIRPERADRPAAAARFLREAQITGQLEHPGIVPVYELGRRPADGQPFYTMRFVRGRTLAEAARTFHDHRRTWFSTLEFRQLLGAFVGVCQAVAFAHARGVVHRDLKPQNVVLGDFGEVMVLDWGLAKVVGRPDVTDEVPIDVDPTGPDGATIQGQVLGTPAYMPPEQAEGRLDLLDQRADVYGLGAILYELLAGRPPAVHGGRHARCVGPRAHHRPRFGAVRVARRAAGAGSDLSQGIGEEARPREIGTPAESGAEYRRAIAIQEVLVHDHPDEPEYANDLAASRMNLGLVLNDAGDRAAGLAEVRRSLGLREELVRRDASLRAYQRNLASAYANLATVLDDGPSGNPDAAEALRNHERALDLRQKLVAADPDHVGYREEVGETFNNLGAWHYTHGTPADALVYYDTARKVRDEIRAKHDTQTRRMELAKTWFNIGLAHRKALAYPDALKAQAQATALLEPLVKDNPRVTVYRLLLAEVSNSVGVLNAESGRPTPALAAFRRAAELREEIARDNPGVRSYRAEQARAHLNLGAMYQKADRPADAIAPLNQALDTYRQLADEVPGDREVRDTLGLTLSNLGAVQSDAGDPKAALETLVEAVQVYSDLLAEDRDNAGYFSGRATAKDNRGVALGALKRWADARSAYREAEADERAVLARRPGNRRT
jgi:tetratricopeptide (TPR) repeat protein/tRNA A-37 threonylcarbamoyl transferase component Bud32